MNLKDLNYVLEYKSAMPIYHFLPEYGGAVFCPIGSPTTTLKIKPCDVNMSAVDGYKAVACVENTDAIDHHPITYLSERQVKNYLGMPL
jgi:hypothetical protein